MKFLNRFITDIPRISNDDFKVFLVQTNQTALSSLRFVCIIAAILFPVFGILDYIAYPNQFILLFAIRCFVVPLILLIYAFTYIEKFHKNTNIMALFLFQIMGFSITLMVIFTEGKISPYYAGLNLVLLTQLVSMPWSFRRALLNSFLVWVLFLISVIVADILMRSDANNTEYAWRLFISSNFFLLGTILIGLVWTMLSFRLRKMAFISSLLIENEKKESDRLLRNILPESIIKELKQNNSVVPRKMEATVLFTDFVGFTSISSSMEPEDVLLELDRAFEYFDMICEKYSMEKIKTIGDSYMCVAGVPEKQINHTLRAALVALEIRSYMSMIQKIKNATGENYWQIRIGLHTGPLVAGVVGKHKFAYDVWGDTVNVASRMESNGRKGEICISDDTRKKLNNYFNTTPLGFTAIKGKGEMSLYLLDNIKEEYSDDPLGRTHNENFINLVNQDLM